MEIRLGNLRSKLITDNPKILEALNNKYAYYVPGYNYVPSYKRHQWDGKKRYFNKDGSFRTGLLKRIIADLEAIGCNNYQVTNKEPSEEFDPKVKTVKNFDYYDYQFDAIVNALGYRRGIIESPVGSGKTLIMAGLVQSLGLKTVILFSEKGILNQTYDFFKKCGIKSLGINSGDGYIYGDVMLSTVQSIEKILDTHLVQAKVLIVDEVHQFCSGESRIAAIEAFPNAIYRIGFTATVPSEKGDIHGRMVLEGAFGPVYSTKSTDDLIKDGKLAKPLIQIVEYSPSGVDDDLTYQEQYSEHIVESADRNSKIASIVLKVYRDNPKARILILVKNLEHLSRLEVLFPNSFTVEGKDSIEDRYEIINKFIKYDGPCSIIGTNVMQTGININEITHMINARGLEGEIPTIQGLGRSLRIAEGKSSVYFYDFYDKVPYLEKHSKSRIKHYENLKFEINYVRIN